MACVVPRLKSAAVLFCRYFKTRGRAEVIRTLFAYANVEYEDVRFDNVDRSEFNAVREQGLLPYGQVVRV